MTPAFITPRHRVGNTMMRKDTAIDMMVCEINRCAARGYVREADFRRLGFSVNQIAAWALEAYTKALAENPRHVPGFADGDAVAWSKPRPPSYALSGTVIGCIRHGTRLVVRSADQYLLILPPDEVTNTTRARQPGATP